MNPALSHARNFFLVSGDVFDQPIVREVIETTPDIPFQYPVRFALAGQR